MEINFKYVLFLTRKRILKTIMKSFIILFCGVAFGFSPNFGFSQNAKILIESDVTLSVEQVFELIQKQTDYSFIYGEDLFKLAPKVNLKKGVIKASKLLEISLVSGNFLYEFTSDKTIVLSRKKETSVTEVNQNLQTKAITGKVTNENGPLLGVTILVRGTAIGTTTDFDGMYTISAAVGDVLEFTFLGMQTKSITVGEADQINVKMEQNTTSLDEIIVTGVAGGTSVKKMTVSVTKVSEEALKMVPATSIAGALVGKVAGARVTMSTGAPGSGNQIQLRSDTNLNGSSSPLIIMDGIIITTSLADINVDDIESMEVVKGAAASALYGSRAANGVIAITSKRGNNLGIGTSNVTVRNEVGFQQISKYLDLAEHHIFKLDSSWEQYKGAYTAFDGVTFPSAYLGGYSPLISGSRKIDDDRYMDNEFGVTRDQQKEFFQTGQTITNFVSYSSNSAKTNVYGSFENNKQTGVVPFTDGYERQNYRLNIDHQIAPWLKLSTSSLFTESNSQPTGGGFLQILYAEPDNDLRMVNPVDGQPYYLRHNHWSNDVNPLYDAWIFKSSIQNTSLITNFKVNVLLNSWANFDVSHSQEIQNYNLSNYKPYDTWTIASGGSNDYGIEYSKGFLQKSSSNSRVKNTQFTLNLAHKFNDLMVKGKISLLDESNEYNFFSARSSGFAVQDLPTLDAFRNIQFANSNKTKELARNYFGILSLDYKDRYLFDLMFRKDGSSLFGSESRWANYYRASGAYRITQDIKIPGVQELKIRAAVGTSGIRPGFNWQYETYALNAGVSSPGQKGNKDLKPSQTKETEIGLDAAFLNKFSFQATYAKSITTNQFLAVPLIPFVSDGFTSQWQNAGTVEGNTLELSLGANWLKKNDFNWTTNVVFAQSKQKITYLPIAPYQSGPDGLFFIKEGETYGAIYGYTWVNTLDQMSEQLPVGKTINDYEVNSDGYVVPAGSQGLLTEKAIRLKEDGAISADAFVKIGDALPKFNLGLSNTITYKGYSLYFLLDVKSGGDLYNKKSQQITLFNRNGIADMSNVAEGNKKTFDYFQGFYDGNSNNSYWVEDASFVKLREVAIGYTIKDTQLPASFKNTIQSITAKIVGRNLLTFTNYSGYDPEVGSTRNPYDAAAEYPNYRNAAFSLTFEF
jgi:TonB-linked SusC/RagA family outer membrane protein